MEYRLRRWDSILQNWAMLDGCDAETIYIKTDTGNVSGTLLTEKVFITELVTEQLRNNRPR